MNAAERAAYLKTQLIANFVINAVLNGVIALFLYQSKTIVTLVEMAWDVEITVAIISFFVAWIAIVSLRKKLAGGFSPNAKRRANKKLPHSAIIRALGIMLLLMVVFGVLLVGGAAVVSPEGFSNWEYVILKSVYTGVCALLSAQLAIQSVFNDRA